AEVLPGTVDRVGGHSDESQVVHEGGATDLDDGRLGAVHEPRNLLGDGADAARVSGGATRFEVDEVGESQGDPIDCIFADTGEVGLRLEAQDELVNVRRLQLLP